MNAQKMIQAMNLRYDGKAFLDATIEEYYDDPDGYFNSVEKDYRVAFDALASLGPDQRKLFEEKEQINAASRIFAARYGVLCGIYSGLRRYFTGRGDEEKDFVDLVEEGLFTAEGMQRYPRFQTAHKRSLAITDELADDQYPSREEYLLSIDCAWDERIHNAAALAFDCGSLLAANHCALLLSITYDVDAMASK